MVAQLLHGVGSIIVLFNGSLCGYMLLHVRWMTCVTKCGGGGDSTAADYVGTRTQKVMS
jgi:uncharacterized membrane protein YgdD (TMEM256/DUF423 family)